MYEYKSSVPDTPVAIQATIDGCEVGAVHAFPGKYGHDKGLCIAQDFVKPFIFAKISMLHDS